MCLRLNMSKTECKRRTASLRRKRTATFYKIYRRKWQPRRGSTRWGWVLKTQFQMEEVKPGVQWSDRKPRSRRLTPEEKRTDRVDHGVHVYLTPEIAKRVMRVARAYHGQAERYRIAKVRCQYRDLVSFGTFDYGVPEGSAVFTKLSLSKNDYDRILHPYRKRYVAERSRRAHRRSNR